MVNALTIELYVKGNQAFKDAIEESIASMYPNLGPKDLPPWEYYDSGVWTSMNIKLSEDMTEEPSEGISPDPKDMTLPKFMKYGLKPKDLEFVEAKDLTFGQFFQAFANVPGADHVEGQFKVQMMKCYDEWIKAGGSIQKIKPELISGMITNWKDLSKDMVDNILAENWEPVFGALETAQDLYTFNPLAEAIDLTEKTAWLENELKDLMNYKANLPGEELTPGHVDSTIAKLKADLSDIHISTYKGIPILGVDSVESKTDWQEKHLTMAEITAQYFSKAVPDPETEGPKSGKSQQELIDDVKMLMGKHPTYIIHDDILIDEQQEEASAPVKVPSPYEMISHNLGGGNPASASEEELQTFLTSSEAESLVNLTQAEKKQMYMEQFGSKINPGEPNEPHVGKSAVAAIYESFSMAELFAHPLAHSSPPAAIDLPPVLKSHHHLLKGKRQRCVNSGCPVGA